MKIELKYFLDTVETALVGKDYGKEVLSRINKIVLIENLKSVEIDIPEEVVTINYSFFNSFLGDEVRKLGEKEFLIKYTFNTSEHIQKRIVDMAKKSRENIF